MSRAYFVACLLVGRLLRSARYSTAVVGEHAVRKHRRFYAPLLVWTSTPLMRILDTGVRFLPQREWEAREQLVFRNLDGSSVDVDTDGVLILPVLAGRTLAALLEDPTLPGALRQRAISLATAALAEFHHRGFTHGDAMAENVLVDLERGVARWFDFETIHETRRSLAWRRADDLRALLTTCLLRTVRKQRGDTLQLILKAYGNAEVAGLLTLTLTSVWRRSLTFHLAQAQLSFRSAQEIASMLRTNVPVVAARYE